MRAIGHPVTWLGTLIGALDRGWNRDGADDAARRMAGIAAIMVVVALTAAIGAVLQRGLLMLPFGLVPAALLASTLLAQRSLYDHVERVAAALETQKPETDRLVAGRAAVAHIVGRDTAALDEAGVARAAIESLAENFSDGVVAPAMWMAIGGLPGAAIYKAINTADSMIGHRTARHRAFGWAAARLDDLVNLPAARLAALLIVAAALPDRAAAAWRTVRRDAHHHRSLNAGYPEAAIAGALDLALAGPRAYGGVVVDDAPMGDGRRAATAKDIRAALRLYRRADGILIGVMAILTAAIFWM